MANHYNKILLEEITRTRVTPKLPKEYSNDPPMKKY